MDAKASVTNRTTQMYLLLKSAHNKVEITNDEIINNPPIVGVPDFL